VRALLLSLGLANLLFFGWSHWIDAPAVGRAAVAQVPALQFASVAPAVAGTASEAAAGAPRCASLGPLSDAGASASLTTALRARNLTPRERRAATVVTDGYWVYIDHLRDTSARGRALRRLASSGVRDAAALADSGQVSVGLFSERDGADKRAAAVRAAGFEPVVEVRSHPLNGYWLDVDLPGDGPPPAVAALAAGLNLDTEPTWGDCLTAAPPASGGAQAAPALVTPPSATPATAP
jgi:hypothetical protein